MNVYGAKIDVPTGFEIAGLFVGLALISRVLVGPGMPTVWSALRYEWWAWREAIRAMAAGPTPSVIERIETSLARVCLGDYGVISLADTTRYRTYIRLAGDDLASHRGSSWTLLLFAVLIPIDGAALGYTLAPGLSLGTSEQMSTHYAVGIGLIGAGLIALAMHNAGRHLYRYRNTREVRRRILAGGDAIPKGHVTSADPQDTDQHESPLARRWVRMAHVTTLLPVLLAIALVVFVAAALWNLRYQEQLQLQAADTVGLLTNSAMLTEITVLSVLLTALQFCVFGVAYSGEWSGRESADAWRRLSNGTLWSDGDVIQHNRRALTFANIVHLRFHQHLQRINSREGHAPVRSVIDPEQVLARMLAEPTGANSTTSLPRN